MLQEAKDLQNRAVTKMVSVLSQGKKEYTFKAPTGSGKTYMMADFMNRVLSDVSEFANTTDEIKLVGNCISLNFNKR